jgi:hypothetical protein
MRALSRAISTIDTSDKRISMFVQCNMNASKEIDRCCIKIDLDIKCAPGGSSVCARIRFCGARLRTSSPQHSPRRHIGSSRPRYQHPLVSRVALPLHRMREAARRTERNAPGVTKARCLWPGNHRRMAAGQRMQFSLRDMRSYRRGAVTELKTEIAQCQRTMRRASTAKNEKLTTS